jgi:cytochrome c5
MRFLFAAFFFFCAAMVACTAHHDIASTANLSLKQAQQFYPTVTSAELTKGADVYQATCQQCHSLHNPNERDKADWDDVLTRMFRKANADSTTQDLIRKYIYSGMKV